VHRCPLVVANVSRLTRSVAFLSRLLEAGVDVRFADMPAIEGPTGRFMLQQMAAVAELEAGLISSRTKAALAAAKARGKKLGGDRGDQLTDKAGKLGCKALTARADARAAWAHRRGATGGRRNVSLRWWPPCGGGGFP
jgi:DNA invertase Pin-like site-specific DNA recombinase